VRIEFNPEEEAEFTASCTEPRAIAYASLPSLICTGGQVTGDPDAECARAAEQEPEIDELSRATIAATTLDLLKSSAKNMPPKRERVSEQDRDYMRRLGEYKQASHRETLREHLALSVEKRLEWSWEFAELCRDNLRNEVAENGAIELYARARRLGIYVA